MTLPPVAKVAGGHVDGAARPHGGVQRGLAYGATDPLGFHATQKRHYVTDLHATALHQLGLDSHRLNRPGRIRLDRDYGNVMRGILA